ncbi:MAG TPA: hypothetical protein VF187_00190 [Gemmatimonadales bacterium]
MMDRICRSLALPGIVILATACGGGSDPTGPDTPTGPPVVLSVNGATQPSGPIGSTVIIEGSNFGGAQGSSKVLFSDGLGGTVAATIVSAGDWTSTFIVTSVPAGAATGGVTVQTSLGTSTALTFTIIQNAVFSPSTINWSATTELPVALSGHALAFAQLPGVTPLRVIYSVGGAGAAGAPVTTVNVATVGLGPAVGVWTATTPLPAAVAFHALVVATPANARITGTGFLYVLGGAVDAAGAPTTAVYRGTLAADGTVSAWAAVTALPAPLHSLGAVIFHGDLYVVGGATTGNAPVATVYRSRIGAAGELGAWLPQPALPFRRAHFGFGVFGNYLYAFGGDSGVVAPNSGVQSNTTTSDPAYARINLRTGDIEAAGWTTAANKLTKSVSKHTTVVAGGNVLVTAGLYNGASSGSTEETYAQLNSDGSPGSFHGATGSNTIASLVAGGNLFNHAAVGYQDGAGVFHVLVAGGDDVNTPGTRHKGVFFY